MNFGLRCRNTEQKNMASKNAGFKSTNQFGVFWWLQLRIYHFRAARASDWRVANRGKLNHLKGQLPGRMISRNCLSFFFLMDFPHFGVTISLSKSPPSICFLSQRAVAMINLPSSIRPELWRLDHIKDVYKGTFTSSAMQLIIKVIKPFNVEKLDIFPTKYTRDVFPQKFFFQAIYWLSQFKKFKKIKHPTKSWANLVKNKKYHEQCGGGFILSLKCIIFVQHPKKSKHVYCLTLVTNLIISKGISLKRIHKK